jgi:hypothetical protein
MRPSSLVSLLLIAPYGSLAERQKMSKDATCGGSKGYTCLNSAWGDCCSQYVYALFAFQLRLTLPLDMVGAEAPKTTYVYQSLSSVCVSEDRKLTCFSSVERVATPDLEPVRLNPHHR